MKPDTVRPGCIEHDDVVKGLHLRAFSQRRSWYLTYRTRQGRRRRPKLGDYPTLTLADARRAARTILVEVAAGRDPGSEWQEAKDEPVLSDVFQACWESHWSRPRFQLSGWAKEVRGYYTRRIEAAFGRKKLSAITPDEIARWHAAMEETPVEANRSLEVLSKLFKFAKEKRLSRLADNPARSVAPFPETKRERFATVDEIRRIGEILRSDYATKPRQVAFISLLALLGIRPRHLERARRSEFHGSYLRFEGKNYAKTRELETVVVPMVAQEIIRKLPQRDDGLLIGPVEYWEYWRTVTARAQCPDLWARDWRRTFGTVGLSHGVSLGVVGELLNHRSVQTTKRYAKLLPDTRTAAAQSIADRMASLLEGVN